MTRFDLGTGVMARPYFTPGRAEKLVHELSQRIATARRRVRICSPVMTSGPVLGTLADIVQRGFEGIDIKGVFDATQMAEVRHQWAQNPQAAWKLSALAAILAGIPFSGKVSTPWATGTGRRLVSGDPRNRTLDSGQHEDCSPMHGFEATREVETRRPEGGTEILDRAGRLDSERLRSA